MLAHLKFLEVLLDDNPSASAFSELPQPQEAAMFSVVHPWGGIGISVSAMTQVPAMLAHEKMDSFEGALACAMIILGADRTQGGTFCKRQHSFAHACRGRILAVQGKADEAQAAFQSAIEVADAGAHHFLAAIALRDMYKHLGGGSGGQRRLEEAAALVSCSVEDLAKYSYP